MKPRHRVVAGLAAACLAAVAAPAAAQGPAVTVVADHLNNPRGVTVAPDGSVYVAEAGKAGPTCLGEGEEQACFAFSSSITRVQNGVAKRVVTGLLSAGGRDGSFTTGADGVGVTANGTIYIAMTAAPSCTPTDPFPKRARDQAGRLLKVGPAGTLSPVVNLNALECNSNPDGTDRNSNPYSVLALGNNREIAVDAGGNTLINVNGRKASVLTKLPRTNGHQCVPTSIATGPDGAYYVGCLDEGAGPGKARVFRVVPGEKPTIFRTGFTQITGLAFGPDGSLYVTQLSSKRGSAPSGAVIKVSSDGATRTVLGEGSLFFPAGAAVAGRRAVRLQLERAAGPHAQERPVQGRQRAARQDCADLLSGARGPGRRARPPLSWRCMADLSELTTMIEASLPGASAEIVDQGGGDHLAATVVAPQFAGLSRLEQHRLVYAAVQSRIDDGSIHALALRTRAPEAT